MTPPPEIAHSTAPEARLLGRVLGGEDVPWPVDADTAAERRFVELCRAEGLAPLVHHLLHANAAWADWPAPVRETLLRMARMEAAADMLREREVIAVLNAFDDANIKALLLKGTPLAYSHYPQSALRTRCDTDALVRPADRAEAMRVLEGLGYRRPNAVSGSLVSYEECYTRRSGHIEHVLDLHWQINNGQVFAHALSFEEAERRSIPVPQLGAAARTLCPVDALLLACMHRAAHLGVDGPDGNRLIWLYDIHLLARRMSTAEWQQFAELTCAKQLRRITLDAFVHAAGTLGTSFPADVIERLSAPGPAELSEGYLHADRLQLLWGDLRALDTWRARITLLKEWAFPPPAYMLSKYDARSRWALPWLYLRRAVAGLRKIARN